MLPPSTTVIEGTESVWVSSVDRERFRELIETRSGLHFAPSHDKFLEGRLREGMRRTGSNSSADYYERVIRQNVPREWEQLLEGLLTRETRFFRHQPSFDALRGRALPELLSLRAESDGPLRMASVGCCTGEEPYSMAMIALEIAGPDFSVDAVDLSSTALSTARAARYPTSVRLGVPHRYRDHLRLEAEGLCRVTRELRERVRFERLDIRSFERFDPCLFDVVFCQNVLIYFEPRLRTAVIQKLLARTRPEGFLFLGPAELLGMALTGTDVMPWRDCLVLRGTADARSGRTN